MESHDDSRRNSVQQDKCKDVTQSTQSLMNETLRNLLATSEDDTMLRKRFEACVQELFLQQGKKCIGSDKLALLPSFWTNVLTKWWNKRSTKMTSSEETQRRKDWTVVLLQLFIQVCEEPRSAESFDWRVFWSFGSRWEYWTRLITSSLAIDDALLRSLAWTSAAQMIEKTSWRIILTLDTTSTWITTVVRLAVGEAKIQLGWIVSSNEALTEDRQILVHATCRILVQCMDLIKELTDCESHDSDYASRPILSVASIQSLHRSLEEALDMTTQYLNLMERRVNSVDASVIQVFGYLLTEFDVFVRPQHSSPYDLSNEQMSNDDQEENTTLLALAAAVQICPSTCRRELLLGLVAVLASAEGDEKRVGSLKKHKLLEDHTIDLLEACWKGDHNTDTGVLAAACDALEVLLDVSPVTPVTDIKSVILEWIRRACLGTTHNRTALDLSLSCYVRLQGDTPPPESDATALHLAYEILDPHGSGS